MTYKNETSPPKALLCASQPPELKKDASQRRIVDARLWDGMTPHQQDSALEISHAFEVMSRGIGFAKSNPAAIPGARGGFNETERQSFLINRYVEWARECQKIRLCHSSVLNILVFGKSCREEDKSRRMRNGMARGNLMEALSLYCKLRGWPDKE